jgi:hypothetical protein
LRFALAAFFSALRWAFFAFFFSDSFLFSYVQ